MQRPEHDLAAHLAASAQLTATAGDLVGRMVARLATEIIEGTLPPGHPLTSVELGDRFGTSRTPVREALAVLQREGLVEIQPRRRPRVAGLTLQEIRDIYEVRSGLYAVIARAVVRGASDGDVALLDRPLALLRREVDSADPLGYFYATVEFRRVEAEICPNRAVGPLIESLGLRTYRLRRFGLSVPGRAADSCRDYTRLVEAYRERDGELAAAVTGALMRKALAVIETHWHELELPPEA